MGGDGNGLSFCCYSIRSVQCDRQMLEAALIWQSWFPKLEILRAVVPGKVNDTSVADVDVCGKGDNRPNHHFQPQPVNAASFLRRRFR